MVTGKVLWSIGSPDGRAPELFDNYKAPNALGDVVWTVPRAGEQAPAQRWPLFHPSEANPDAGYRPHLYTIRFPLDQEPRGAYQLRIQYLVIAPRLAHLELIVNGVAGRAYLRPAPSRSNEIRLHAGLHTTIYAEGEATIIIPAALLRRGANRLELIARDGGDILVVENPEAIKRLDRMADGAGFIYQCLTFSHLAEEPSGPLIAATPVPTVVYQRGPDGALVERCHLDLELARETASDALTLELREGERRERVALPFPAAPFGHLRLPRDLFDGPSRAVEYRLHGSVGGEAVALAGTLTRRRKWTVFLAPHAHTDIGYTHRQWEVAERLCRNIDAALDRLAAEGSGDTGVPPFTYHLDASWVLENYLATRGAGRRRQLAAAVVAGRISVASNYIDPLTQYAALEDLIRNGEFTAHYLRPLGREADFAAIVDVASLTSAFPAILAGSGVRYLVHANNQDRGPFRLNGGLHRRSPFYWAGPGGGRILVWLAKMYCKLRKVCGSPPVPSAAARGLDLWLAEYEHDDYAPDAAGGARLGHRDGAAPADG